MNPKNIYKYLYFLIILLLIVGYILITKKHLNHKYTILFYIRYSVVIYLFYILSDSLLYTLLFGIFIFIAVNIHYRNTEIEQFNNKKSIKYKNKKDNKNKKVYTENEENLIEMNNNKKTMETFFEFSNKLLENKDLIKEHNSKFYKDKKKYKNLSNKIDAFQEKLNENLKK